MLLLIVKNLHMEHFCTIRCWINSFLNLFLFSEIKYYVVPVSQWNKWNCFQTKIVWHLLQWQMAQGCLCTPSGVANLERIWRLELKVWIATHRIGSYWLFFINTNGFQEFNMDQCRYETENVPNITLVRTLGQICMLLAAEDYDQTLFRDCCVVKIAKFWKVLYTHCIPLTVHYVRRQITLIHPFITNLGIMIFYVYDYNYK